MTSEGDLCFFFFLRNIFSINHILQHLDSNINKLLKYDVSMFSGKEIKPPIYFLLPVCAGGCSWPACGQPAGC